MVDTMLKAKNSIQPLYSVQCFWGALPHPSTEHNPMPNYYSTPLSAGVNNVFIPQYNNPVCSQKQSVTNSMHVDSTTDALLKVVGNLQLPKAELIEFDGNPLRYWVFVRAFENAVDSVHIDDGAKLTRLIKYCTGKARKVVEGCSVLEPSAGYRFARKLLHERFGNSTVISQAWVNKVTDRRNIKSGDGEALLDLSDDLRHCTETLRAMNSLDILNENGLVKIVEKLPEYLQHRWMKIVHHIRTIDIRSVSVLDLVKFVSEAAGEANDPVFGKVCQEKVVQKRYGDRSHNRRPAGTNFSTQTDKHNAVGSSQPSIYGDPRTGMRECILCCGKHSLFACDKFKAMKVSERFIFVKEKRLCFNCLAPHHSAASCKKPIVCSVEGCGKKHSKFLHSYRGPVSSNSAPPKSDSRPVVPPGPDTVGNPPSSDIKAESSNSRSNERVSAVTGAGKNITVALPIVPVKVSAQGGVGPMIETYALLDTGSSNTFCSAELVEKLGLEGTKEQISLTTLDRKANYTETEVVDLEVLCENENGRIELPHVYTRPKLNILPNTLNQEDVDKWSYLQGIDIPKVQPDAQIDLLIGQDHPEALIPSDIRRGGKQEPYATRTIFGWTLNGPMGVGSAYSTNVMSHFISADDSLTQQVERFWKLDGVLDDEQAMSVNDRRVIAEWDKSVCLVDNHYEAKIPFKYEPPCMPDNLRMAEHRLQLLGKRLMKNPHLHDKYKNGMCDLLQKGYAERVPQAELARSDGRVWYLPHQPVINPKKPDKLRIVFDCSAKDQGTSLNEQVLQGPDLTNSLLGVLLRFRQEPIGLMADIEGMFNQVCVSRSDRDVLRFLWWVDGDIGKTPVVYRMKTHLFGGIWSPSVASYALKRTARDNEHDFPIEVTDTIESNFYVDDCLRSVAEVEQAVSLVKQLCTLLARGGFRLTKWLSNNEEVIRSIPESERAKTVRLEAYHELPTERALGVLWHVSSDTLGFDVALKEKPPTRRGMLSILSSVFDPYGFVSPFVLLAKVMFQKLCRLKIGWDQNMPPDVLSQWLRWCKDLPKLENMFIPRCLKPPGSGPVMLSQIHHFSDASEKGYGCVSYLRSVDSEGKIHCGLLMSKAKLAPLKPTTIPRLELSAAVVAVKMDKVLRQELQIPLRDSMFWTDSMIVLSYIENTDKRFLTFVANRVALIQQMSSPSQWQYVDTKSNPADDVSRGLTADELLGQERWKPGPDFLWQNEDKWPQRPASVYVTDDLELKPEKKVYVTEAKTGATDTLFTYFSSWYRLKKAVGWILRLKTLLRNRTARKHNGVTDLTPEPNVGLTVDEMNRAEVEIVKFVQRQHFSVEIKALQGGGHVRKQSSMAKLSPVIDSRGAICVGGRLQNAPISSHEKHQVILPGDSHVVRLLIREKHQKTGHSGTEYVLSELRQHYWLIRGRVAVKQVLRSCVTCRRRSAPPGEQFMADLPKDRVTPDKPPFTYIGLDYFGPFMVKRGRCQVKRYGCIFTCLVLRAIHIEVAHSLDTDSFLNALHRFISRRGCPDLIRSDNGTNLVGGERELRESIAEWNKQKIHDTLRQQGIRWNFNPPAASHMGGAWERQIRSVRKVLNGLSKEQVLDDEGLSTLMCMVEAIVNGRPITKLSEDPSDLEPLTPSHLLVMRSSASLPPGLFSKQDVYGRRRWRQVQYMANVFWRRWLREYIPNLQIRQRWLHPSRNLALDDIVLLVDENMPRGSWSLGRVIEVHPGKDGHVRSVVVKTQNSQLTRPIDKLCLLESSDEG